MKPDDLNLGGEIIIFDEDKFIFMFENCDQICINGLLASIGVMTLHGISYFGDDFPLSQKHEMSESYLVSYFMEINDMDETKSARMSELFKISPYWKISYNTMMITFVLCYKNAQHKSKLN